MNIRRNIGIITGVLSLVAASGALARDAASQVFGAHMARVVVAADATPEDRAAAFRGANLVKRVKWCPEVIVGRYVSPETKDDIGVISLYGTREGANKFWHDDFHYAADKAIIPKIGGPHKSSLSYEILTERNANDEKDLNLRREEHAKKSLAWVAAGMVYDKSQPKDRPQDQVWKYGSGFFQVIRVAAPDDAMIAQLKAAAGKDLYLAGWESGRTAIAPTGGYAVVVKFAGEAAYQAFKAKVASIVPADAHRYFIVDQANEALATRLQAG